MRFRRPRARMAALFALAGMLFLQAAIALAACELPGRSAAMAVAQHAADMPECHEADADGSLCLAHCQGEEQRLVKVPATPDLTAHPGHVLRLAKAPARLSSPPVAPHVGAAGPPPRILYQSFLL